MPIDFSRLTHAGIQTLNPYIPGKTIEAVAKEQGLTDIIKLASNENAWGCSDRVYDAIAADARQNISLYPNAISHDFRQKLADFLGIEPACLLLCNGSDCLIDLLLICFALHQNKHVLTHQYAFCNFEIRPKVYGVPIIKTPTEHWEVDIDAIIQTCNQQTALIFIANPNNPTGTLIPHKDIKRLLESIPTTTLLVLDEAYYEYACASYQANSLELLQHHKNLIITRTFSKAYGLAGLRLGYAIAHPQIIQLLYKIQLPFSVNTMALTAASAAIDDQDFIQKTVKLTAEGMQQMQTGLETLHINYLPTFANFITMDCQMDGSILFERLQAHGIIVRPLHPYDMNQYVRVTIGTHAQNKRFLESLSGILKK